MCGLLQRRQACAEVSHLWVEAEARLLDAIEGPTARRTVTLTCPISVAPCCCASGRRADYCVLRYPNTRATQSKIGLVESTTSPAE